MKTKGNIELVNSQLLGLRPEDVEPYSSFEVDQIHTIIAKPPKEVQATVAIFAEELQSRYPVHYYYTPDQYHVTLLGLGRAKDVLGKLSPIHEVLAGKELEVKAKGVGANKFGVSIPVYSETSILVQLRAKLRDLFMADKYTQHSIVWEQMLWINFMRFKEKPSVQLLKDLQKHTQKDFGSYTVTEWQLFRTTSRVLDPDASELVATF